MTIDFEGQWLGSFAGSNLGRALVEIEPNEAGDYRGQAYVYDDKPNQPSFFAKFDKIERGLPTTVSVKVWPLHPQTYEPTTWEQIKNLYSSDLRCPEKADVTFALEGDQLVISWVTDIGTSSTGKLPRSESSLPSIREPLANVTSWQDFKTHVSGLEPYRYIFRGQEEPWRLRTAFHRSGRLDLVKFLNEDMTAVYRNLTFRTRHVIDRADADQWGAFIHMVQHYGYPTPLLDWTYSPFVAAFFGYRPVRQTALPDKKIRIFKFDKGAWMKDFRQLAKLTHVGPHFSVAEFMAIDNARMVPQQGLSTITNLDDVETYIALLEAQKKKTYLEVIDLPYGERPIAINDLQMMGVTAGSLLPGIDGACEELKERFFPWKPN